MILFGLTGGLALFIFGLNTLKDNLEQLAGEKIRYAIHRMTGNVFYGILTGIIITFIFQSSSATSVLLIGFANAELINLIQAMGVILGADIGTTFTVQIISWNVYDYSIIFIAAGVLLSFTKKRKRVFLTGNLLIGVGMVFLGMKIMSDATAPLKNADYFQKIIEFSRGHPLWLIIVATVFTAIIQTSAGTIGLLISISSSAPVNSIDISIPVIFGANIGTCATAIIAALPSTREGKKIAVGHLFFKVAGVIIFYPFRHYLADIASFTAETLPRQIANAHTIFNLMITLIFLPFVNLIANFINLIVLEEAKKEEKFGPRYLDYSALRTPSLALAYSMREILRMADIVADMLKRCLTTFRDENVELIAELKELDNKVDVLYQELKMYLTKTSLNPLSDELANLNVHQLTMIINLENLGDVIDKNILLLAQKRHKQHFVFSTEGFAELTNYHNLICQNFDLAISAFAGKNSELARQVIMNSKRIDDLLQTYTENHLQRLRKGLKESMETSSIHLDLLSNLHRINTYITNCVYPLIQRN
jgi:phosphate:Na+ symporter